MSKRGLVGLGALLGAGCFAEPAPVDGSTAGASSGAATTENTSDATDDADMPDDASSGAAEDASDGGSSDASDATTDSGPADASSGAAAVCGDGITEGNEACDETPEPVRGGCRPDCTPIPTKQISLSNGMFTGDLGGDPVTFADASCPDGSKAMFAFGTDRRATTAPWGAVDPVDWVLAPYTAYVRSDGVLLWVTDDVPLLGLRGGIEQSLLAPLVARAGLGIATGMTPDWRTSPSQTCSGWTVATDVSDKRSGVSDQTQSDGYLDNGGIGLCSNFDAFYCVEQ